MNERMFFFVKDLKRFTFNMKIVKKFKRKLLLFDLARKVDL